MPHLSFAPDARVVALAFPNAIPQPNCKKVARGEMHSRAKMGRQGDAPRLASRRTKRSFVQG